MRDMLRIPLALVDMLRMPLVLCALAFELVGQSYVYVHSDNILTWR